MADRNLGALMADLHTSDSRQMDWLEQSVRHLSEGFPAKMAILDCETTGGKASHHRMIELAILLVDDGQIIERWQSFFNPGVRLPPFIQNLTGIRPEDVRRAPRFEELASDIENLLSDRVFVAHNARFDYGFLKNEFKRAGIGFSTKPLCSVKFSRALYPQFKRHGLDAIIRRFGFQIDQRHRAMDDAEMIYRLFEKASGHFPADEIAGVCESLRQQSVIPQLLTKKQVDALPKAAGVYYFYDEKGSLLYVGKSVNVRQRVLSHFAQDYRNNKDLQMSPKIAHIECRRTPGDLGAQILESQEIKRLSPHYNKRLRRVRKLYQIQLCEDESGYLVPDIQQLESGTLEPEEQFGLFRSQRQASKFMEKLADQYFLCHRLMGLEGRALKGLGPCFRAQLKKCFGACHGGENPQDYNQRVETAFRRFQTKVWPWESAILIEEQDSNEPDQSAYHLVDQWCYLAKLTEPSELYDWAYAVDDRPVKGTSLSEQAGGSQLPCENTKLREDPNFDLDIYLILVRFLLSPQNAKLTGLRIHPLRRQAE